jgi:hypothetical protein
MGRAEGAHEIQPHRILEDVGLPFAGLDAVRPCVVHEHVEGVEPGDCALDGRPVPHIERPVAERREIVLIVRGGPSGSRNRHLGPGVREGTRDAEADPVRAARHEDPCPREVEAD